ncbi:MAG TPA: integrin alpha [bacterium]|nr:FG-GAP repeat protein [bacterium]MDX9806553.1 integrin alpha [bacterium]HOB70614.1 integrin alpha [bacterium]HPV20842.1 integrin alpha [bacterium]HPY15332.1 integrin alpha [bacterium]
MTRITAVILMLTGFIFFSCSNSSTKSGNDSEMNDEATDIATDGNTDDLSDEVLTESEVDTESEETNDSDTVESQQIQTGGIYIFSYMGGNDEKTLFDGKRVLGQGGFFGYSIFNLNEKYWAVGALHESIPPYDFEKATGRMYVFEKGQIPGNIGEAAFVLTHPDLLYNAGFSFTAAGTCDINKDGFDDIAVSAHLATYGDAYAAGEIVVFYGTEDGWNEENTSISRVSDGLIQKADSMSQSLVCGDIDGDGFADVLAGGQNAGPELSSGGSQGMVAFFKGSADGLGKNESWTLLPEVEEKAQYFGSSMILEDINGDEIQDLIVSGWGLKESGESDNTGGVYIYHGGTDWQQGPSEKHFGIKDSQFGSVIRIVQVEGRKGLGVIATQEDIFGRIHFFGNMSSPFDVPDTLMSSDSGSFSDFLTVDGIDGYDTLVIAGGKYFFGGTGGLLCAGIGQDYAFKWEKCQWHPGDVSGGFGSSILNIGDINGDKRPEIVVGMPEYIHTVTD